MSRAFGLAAVILVVLAGAIQAVPYGHTRANPPVRLEPAWDSPGTRDLVVRACFDCHSNQTVWPWYSGIAPVSWLVQQDVHQGRRKLNFSEWDRRQTEAHESARAVSTGEMPPRLYAWPGTASSLSPEERAALVRGLEATFGSSHGSERRRRDSR
jgi:heme-binding protein